MLVRTTTVSFILFYITSVITHVYGGSIPVPHQSTRALNSPPTFYLFTISPYQVELELKNEETLKNIAENINTATTTYLAECINRNLLLHGVAEGSMHKLEMNVKAYELTDDGRVMGSGNASGSGDQSGALRKTNKGTGMHVKTIIDGQAIFRKIALVSGSDTNIDKITQEDIRTIVRTDCLKDDSTQYLDAISDFLPLISSAVVITEVPEHKRPTNNLASKSSLYFTLLVSLSLLILIGLLYMHFSRNYYLKRRRQYNEDGFGLLTDIETFSDECDEDRLQRLESEITSEGGSDENARYVPVPARDNEGFIGISRRRDELVKVIAPKRYVQPASPFDVLYGAAFSHHDQGIVEEAHRPKFVKKSRSSRRRSSVKSKPLHPMVAISEENENHKIPFSPEPMSSLPQFMARFSSFLSPPDNQDNKQEKSRVDDMVVYRDFPRHDGTPCVMYTPKDELDWNYIPQLKIPRSAHQDNDIDDNVSESSMSQSSSIGSSMVAGIDNFVDKLERLIAARSRQYQERVKMDKEGIERRKAHEKKRFKDEKITQLEDETKPVIINTKVSGSIEDEQELGNSGSAVERAYVTPYQQKNSDSEAASSLMAVDLLNDKRNYHIIDKIHNEDSEEAVENTGNVDTKANEIDSIIGIQIKATKLMEENMRPSTVIIPVDEKVPFSPHFGSTSKGKEIRSHPLSDVNINLMK